MKRIVAILLTLIMVMGAFTGCGSIAVTENETGQTVENKEASGDESATPKDYLNISMLADTTNLDPQGHEDIYSNLIDVQIFDTLIYVDEKGQYEMILAENMEQSEDAREIKIEIKKGIKFSNGEELKANDVKFSFDRGINSPVFGAVKGIEGVDIIDDYSVVIRFREPTAYMDFPIASIFIVNEKAVSEVGEDYGNSIEGVIGTGAYKITSWEKGQSISLTRNEDYWRGAAQIKDITVKIIGDQSTAALALEKGEIDYIFDGDPLQEKTLKNAENVQIITGPTNAMTFITVNCDKAPFNNVDFRKAVAYAVNREDIVTIAKEGNAKVTGHFVLDTMEGHAKDVDSPKQDLEKAKKYLGKSGYKEGSVVSFISYDDESARTGAVIQDTLNTIGINVEIESMEFGAYVDRLFNADYDMGIMGFMNMDNAGFYIQVLHSEAGFNIAHYSTPELDKLFDAGKKELDETKRNEIYKELQEVMRDEQIFIPLYVITQYMYVNKDLEGVKVYPLMLQAFRELSWK